MSPKINNAIDHTYTEKQEAVMAFLREYIELYDRSPTLGEIATFLGVTTPTAHGHIVSLTKKGAIAGRRQEARSLTIRDPKFKPDTSAEARIRRMATKSPDFKKFIIELADELKNGK